MTERQLWENQFNAFDQVSKLYIGTQENRGKILDLKLDVKKAELAERKIEDRAFCAETARSMHPRNFLARWGMHIRLRIRYHNHRKEILEDFKAEQKAERDEIAANIKSAKADFDKTKKAYELARSKGEGSWLEDNRNAVASISATAKASSHIKLQTPIMKHIALSDLRLTKSGAAMQFSGTMTGKYDTPLRSMTLHYQFLSRENKILGGGSEWVLDGLDVGESRRVDSRIALPIEGAAKVVYSIDFDVVQLLEEN